MGRRSTANTTTNTNANKGYVAKAHIKGVVSDFYDKGKKYDYITIDVPHGYDEYYDRLKVAVNKSYDVPDNGEDIEIDCYIKTYKGDISFKEIHADDTSNK